jgi:hypothetical protein
MGSNTPKKNRIVEVTAEQTLVDGFNKHPTAIPSMVINGTVRTAQDIVTTLQSRIDSAKEVLSSRATWQAAIQKDETLRDTTKTFVSGVRQGLVVAFAGQVDMLADFGLTARAKHVATPEENIARTAKAKATRAARHTMGSKQKAEIKGTVAPTAPVTTAPAAPAPVPPAAPPVQPVAPPATAPTTAPVTPATSEAPTHGA